MARLVIVRGFDDKRVVPLDGKKIAVGRDPANQLVLDESLVSQSHAEIFRTEEGRFQIKDLRSNIGTTINGRRINEHQLVDGDLIEIGKYGIQYEEFPAAAVPGASTRDTTSDGPGQWEKRAGHTPTNLPVMPILLPDLQSGVEADSGSSPGKWHE